MEDLMTLDPSLEKVFKGLDMPGVTTEIFHLDTHIALAIDTEECILV